MASLLDVVKNNNPRMVKLLVAVPGCIPEKEVGHALQVAAQQGFVECVKILLEGQGDGDSECCWQWTALKSAAECGHAEVLNLLAEQGHCDVNQRSQTGATALHYAASKGHNGCVKGLLCANARTGVKDSGGCTPLILAAKNCHRALGAAKLLLGAGCELDAQDNQGRTALHYAAHKAIGVQLLLTAGANPNLRDQDGNTPLLLAATEGFDNVVKCLLSYNCDPDVMNNYNNMAIHFLAMKNHWEGIDAILHHGGSMNVADGNGNVPLWYAVNHNRPEAVKSLLKGNCHPGPSLDDDGKPLGGVPLEAALDKKLYGVAKLLILAGCDLGPLYDWLQQMQSAPEPTPQSIFWGAGDGEESDEEDEEEEEALEWFEEWLHRPHTLRQICRIHIRRCLGRRVLKKGEHLPLPKQLRDYVKLLEVEDLQVDGSLM